MKKKQPIRYNEVVSVITIPRPLRERLGDDGVDALIAVINESNLRSRDDLATKNDISRVELRMESIKSDLELKIESNKSETLKWMFIFWAGQLVAFFAMLKAFLK
ncbi:LA_3696 family protein [Candidatus Magnetominusculus dajiuhuensis]|uniref:LA_3696 family protein n=1 Tax=Candidatus Magnetominusculus dajiuhuensis TaxID=3137712 RepID=UPI003B430B40